MTVVRAIFGPVISDNVSVNDNRPSERQPVRPRRLVIPAHRLA